MAGPVPATAATPDVDRRRHLGPVVLAVVAVLALVGFVVYAVAAAERRSAQPVTVSSNLIQYAKPSTSPSFTMARLGGGPPVTAAALAGHPLAVNFFASWCTACQAEISTFAAAWRQERSKLDIIAVDINDTDPGKALAMLRAVKAGYPVGISRGMSLATEFGVGDLPATVFVNAKGKVVGEVLGKLPKSELIGLMSNLATGKPLATG